MQWEKLQPKYMKVLGAPKRLDLSCAVNTNVPIIKSVVEEGIAQFCAIEEDGKHPRYTAITFKRGMDGETLKRIKEVLGDVYVENDEGYFIDSTSDEIIIRSASERGLFYGAQAISVFMEGTNNLLPSLVAYEYPIASERGVKCYIPSVDHIPFFKKFIDMMCRYRHNTLLLEIGGSMEYKQYPEINTEWIKFADEMREFSGKTTIVQEATYTWRKNSMHVENGDGGFISQDMVRELVQYCKERYINVIPEVLSLGHCDYLVRAFPEISERANDPYPDTYCPFHPKTYRILFNILDEIIDLFEPTIVHVGHDEWYTYGKCPRCKGRDPADIFAYDINKLYDYLHSRGIKMMMWSEKLLDARAGGHEAGGADKPARPAYANDNIMCEGMGPTYKAIEKIPRDIKMLHWYWGMDEVYDMEYLSRNMPTTYGNYAGTVHTNFKKRMAQGVLGGLCSNWSTLSEEIMCHNSVIFETAYNGSIFWDPDYDSDKNIESMESIARDLYHWKNQDALYGQRAQNFIRVLHTTTRDMPYKMAADGVFLEKGDALLGHYVVTVDTTDGLRQDKLPVYYGQSIANIKDRFDNPSGAHETADGSVKSSVNTLKAVSYTALPVYKNGETWYEAIYKLPTYIRGFTVTDVKFEQVATDCEVKVDKIEVL